MVCGQSAGWWQDHQLRRAQTEPESFILLLVTHYNSAWSICRLVAGPPATLCTDRTKITVDEGGIELCPQGEEVYTVAEALHPGQDVTYVIPPAPILPFFVRFGCLLCKIYFLQKHCFWSFPTKSYSLRCGATCESHQTSWLESTGVCGVRQTQRQTS